jgi:CBS domain-containing protein
MGRVADILARKGSQVHTIQKNASAFEALEAMVDRNVGSLVVLDGETIAGIFTERDYLRRVAREGRVPTGTPVHEVMTECLMCLDPDRSVQDCMAIMTQERIRHLPVLEAGRLAGLVSIGDLVKHLSAEKEVEVRYLTDYIVGKYPA